MSDVLNRITLNPQQCGGRPCIRGMRIRVSDVLDLFAEGLSSDQVLEELPDLETDDIRAALIYAARKWVTCGNTSNKRLREILTETLPEALRLLQAGEPLVELSAW